ncbi:MAG: DUF3857 and transglutaminase domain-containing protein [Cyclobacteriaceae bacterium]|nr:DUF3857 and transglutaminase domain-containing protein [Cyclobacteriaceae bacterium]
MKYTISFLLLMTLCKPMAMSQQCSTTFGVLSQDEINMKSYGNDPDAGAVVLYDIGESEFIDTQQGFDIKFTHTKKIKIFSNSSIDEAEIKVPYYVDGYGKTEMIEKIQAYSYNFENGRTVKKILDEKNIYDEIINERWRAKKFVIPDVKAGTIIEYKVELITPFHFNLPDWEFQDNIPTIYSKYTVKLIPFYEYMFIAQGINKFTHQSAEESKKLDRTIGSIKYKEMIYTFVMENVPAFTDEAYITSDDDYLMKLDFQLAKINSLNGPKIEIMTSWEDMNKELLKHQDFGKHIKKSAGIAKDLLNEELQVEGLDALGTTKAIVEYVKSAFSWNGNYAKYASKDPKALMLEKSGNAADINLFLIGMLQAAGIEAKPVVLSTRNHGKIKTDYPFSHFFNDVIALVVVEGQIFLTDGTETHLAFNRIPPMCINEKGLVVDEKEAKWIFLNTSILSKTKNDFNIKLNTEDMSADVLLVSHASEFESLNYKKKYNNDSTQLTRQMLQKGFSEVNKLRTMYFDKPDKSYIMAFEGKTKVDVIDDKFLISPFLNLPMNKNLLTHKTRSYPVDFIYPNSDSYQTNITIPDDYVVLDMPEDLEIKNDLANIILKYQQTKNVVTVTGEYTFKKSTYEVNEYDTIKSYLDTVVKKFNTQIVIGKKES